MQVWELRDLLQTLDDAAEVVVAVNIIPETHGLWTKAVPVHAGVTGWYDTAFDCFYFEASTPGFGEARRHSGAICLCPTDYLKLRKARSPDGRTRK